MSSLRKTYLTPERYLELERANREARYEYIDGEMLLMAGATRPHNLIGLNTATELNVALRASPCEVYANDMKVRATPKKYFYPAVVVVCDEPQFVDEEADVLSNPLVVVEVLSDSTESYDRGFKFDYYRRIESLKTYVLVSQTNINIHIFNKNENGEWSFRGYTSDDKEILIPSLNLRLDINEIYRKVQFKGEESNL